MNETFDDGGEDAKKKATLAALQTASTKLKEARAPFEALDSPPFEVRLLGEEVGDVLTRVNEQRDQAEGDSGGS